MRLSCALLIAAGVGTALATSVGTALTPDIETAMATGAPLPRSGNLLPVPLNCLMSFARQTAYYIYNKITVWPPTPAVQKEKYLAVMGDVPVLNEPFKAADRLSPAYLMRYFLYTSYAACYEKDARSMTNVTVGANKLPLQTGDMRIVAWQDRWGEHWFVGVSDTQRTVTISFRGTYGMQDVITDMDGRITKVDETLFPRAPPRSDIYAGIQRSAGWQFPGARDAFMAVLADNPGYQPVITGFSLGGAVARLFALHLRLTQPQLPKAFVYTYGMPIATNVDFSNWALDIIGRDHYARVITVNDITPNLREIKGDFGHATNAIVIYFSDPDRLEIVRCENDTDPRCGADIPCHERGWRYHGTFAGLRANKWQCLYAHNEVAPADALPDPNDEVYDDVIDWF
ncbi:Alpha/Beta hydrolase protein [Thamnocephalis sphaerospora]|uniref:Alpha/Beta hydrolase protein n=1 Tax=Thamnocephalis sphaerospora TaxID=78915 RepID=A0A4V1IWG8_9FUNG|nr:Alpha/Beta hydrolase protein [Thamnocephalis sphaerospora]|eukprot:RKP07509.1 Alpha/Beta hydrolase protein [Thamnocephalis sphaerospora]